MKLIKTGRSKSRAPLGASVEARAQQATDQAIAFAAERIDALAHKVDQDLTAHLQTLINETVALSNRRLAEAFERRVQISSDQAIAFATAKHEAAAETGEKLLKIVPSLLNATATVPALSKLLQSLRSEVDSQRQAFDTLAQHPAIASFEAGLSDRLRLLEQTAADFAERDARHREALAALEQRLASSANGLAAIQAALDHDTATDRAVVQESRDLWKSAERTNAEIANLWKSAELATSEIGKLWQRTEFIRAEILYEMKHGLGQTVGAISSERSTVATKPRIINSALVDAPPSGRIRLNLGCGHVPKAGFVNVDFRPLPDVDVVSDVDALPFAPGTIAEVFSAHVLEHFPEQRLKRLLPYWLSLLEPGGSFRAIVPDGEAMLSHYGAGNYSFENFREVLFGGQEYDGDFHFNLFTPDSLATMLIDSGYVGVAIIEKGRPNGSCFEFEIVAERPVKAKRDPIPA